MAKIKVKTRKAATKRFSLTKNKKLSFKKAGKGHILTKKSSKRKRQKNRPGILKKCETKKVVRMMPYA